MVKLSADTLKAFKQMDAASRERAQNIVRDHVTACMNLGMQPDNLDRVYIEAMEIVRMELPEEAATQAYEPFRRYEQYQSPREM